MTLDSSQRPEATPINPDKVVIPNTVTEGFESMPPTDAERAILDQEKARMRDASDRLTTPTPPRRGRGLSGRAIAGVAGGLLAIGLVGGGAAVIATQNPPVAAESGDPTLAPEGPGTSATPAPEASPTTPETQTNFVVNYERFGAEWDAADRAGRLAICGEFFANNPPKTAIVPNPNLTGPEVAEWYGAVLEVVYALDLDTSNPNNPKVAKQIAECVTTVHDSAGDGRATLVEQLTISEPGFEVKAGYIIPEEVTRYSDGIFRATDYQGISYDALVVEGRQNDPGNSLVQQVYEWQDSEAFPSFASTGVVSGDTAIKYGDIPPVVLDQSRANAPWQG